MPSIVVLFNLQDEGSRDKYESWAKSTDLPTVKALKSIDDFKVYKLNEVMGTSDAPPYQYCEVIEVNDMDTFGAEIATETMTRVAQEFQAFADNPIFVVSEQIG